MFLAIITHNGRDLRVRIAAPDRLRAIATVRRTYRGCTVWGVR